MRTSEDLENMTDNSAPRALASGFEPATYDVWRQLVEKALKGADFDKRLVARTADGLRIEPLYSRANELKGSATAAPGAAPFTRGTKKQPDGLGWQIHQRVSEPDPAAANKVILEELEGGAGGVVLQVESPGQYGVKIASPADMAAALTSVYLDYAPVQIRGGLNGLHAARHLLDALPTLGVEPGTVTAHLNLDPLGTFARFGSTWDPLETALTETVRFSGEAQERASKLTSILVDATVPHEAGASEAQELAFLAAALVTYLRAFEAEGVAATDALRQIAFTLSVDTDLFLTAAKVRAARRIVARIGEASNASPAAMHITAVSSERMMAKRDPWTNMLRTTAACAGAAFGGADAITLLPYTWALGAPDRFARRIARNTQLVLQEESSLGRVVDPAGGSWYVEKLTDDLTVKSWSLFQDIEAKGGLAASLSSGYLQDEIARIADSRSKAVAMGAAPLTGVSVFPLLADNGVKVTPHPNAPPISGKQRVHPLVPHRLAEAFEALRDVADAALAKTGKQPSVFLANLGEIVEHNTRSTWVWNFLAAGGIEGLTNDGYKDAAAAAAAFKKSGADVACLCSSDTIYADQGEAAAKALKDAGAVAVLMAGRPGDNAEALKAAGVDNFLFAGQDAIATLQSLHKTLGIN